MPTTERTYTPMRVEPPRYATDRPSYYAESVDEGEGWRLDLTYSEGYNASGPLGSRGFHICAIRAHFRQEANGWRSFSAQLGNVRQSYALVEALPRFSRKRMDAIAAQMTAALPSIYAALDAARVINGTIGQVLREEMQRAGIIPSTTPTLQVIR